mgnify:CR=1 FL=1
MKYVIKILKKELIEWTKEYRSEKVFFKGSDKMAKKSFKNCQAKIYSLKEAIDVLESKNYSK